jgi:cellulose synthase (UDP-forming)
MRSTETNTGEADSPGSHGSRNHFFRSVFSDREKLITEIGVVLAIAAFGYFWMWWLQPEHYHTLGRYILTTLVFVWLTLQSMYFILIASRAQRFRSDVYPIAADARVAIVVTKAPSEPFAVVRETLVAALNQRGVSYDTWLADEDPDEETRDWCAANGVKLSTRKNAPEYHRDNWPRRKKCKEGNLAYFYDKYGYENYDFVSQFDADHVPEPDYLYHAIAPFADPAVGYVSAPSICDSNAAQSWSARGRLYAEGLLHGPLQAGYNNGWAPICIGSHYTVRTRALREIGGLGPELAEDHSTTLIFNAGGWRGVHAIDAIAHGLGPESFSDMVRQEFQWSRSIVTILLAYTRPLLAGLPWHIRCQFIFAQLWYPVYSLVMMLLILMPIFALVTRQHFVNITYIDFLTHLLPLVVVFLGLAFWWRASGISRPADSKIMSWEGASFILLRWPWTLFGSAMAVVDHIRGEVAPFRVTPKGEAGSPPQEFYIVAPHIAISIATGLTAWITMDAGSAGGFYLFNLINAAIYAILVGLVLWRHIRDSGLSILRPGGNHLAIAGSVAACLVMLGAGTANNGAKGVAHITSGISAFSLTQQLYPVSGAGQTATNPRHLLRFRWRDHKAPEISRWNAV